MADNTIILQGNFTATGVDKYLPFRSSIDWMKVYNYTTLAAGGAGTGVEFYWQRGMAAGYGLEYQKLAADDSMSPVIITSGGFTWYDSSDLTPGTHWAVGSANQVTAVSTAAIPVVTNDGANGLVAGDVVRLDNITNAQQFGGIDMTVGYNTLSGVSFDLSYMPQLAVAGTTAGWRKIPFDPYYYPRHRYITAVTTGTTTVIKTSVTHGYKVGQKVRFIVPSEFGMSELNGLQGTITAVDETTTVNTFTVNIDTSAGFTAFAWPLAAVVKFSPAMVVPVGEDISYVRDSAPTVSEFTDATINTAEMGMKLGTGVDGPAGVNTNVIYWVAGKSFSF